MRRLFALLPLLFTLMSTAHGQSLNMPANGDLAASKSLRDNIHPLLVSDDGVIWRHFDSLQLGCETFSVRLRDTSQIVVGRRWQLWSDTLVAEDTAASFSVDLDTGRYTLMFSSVDTAGCHDTASGVFVVYPNPYAAFTWLDSIPSNLYPEVRFYNHSEPAGMLTYLWNIENMSGGDTSTKMNPYYSWGKAGEATEGTYDVMLTAYWRHWYDTANSVVCIDTVTHSVEITNVYLQFPNLVTPNGDGQNDYWRVVNLTELGNYPMNEVWIYDRWGTVVWHMKNMKSDRDRWDPNDTRSPEGTYYFRFTACGLYGIVKRNGVIEVLRKD